MKLRKRKKTNLFLTIILIILNIFIILSFIGIKITPKIEDLIKKNISKNIYSYVFKTINTNMLDNEELLDVISLNLNNKGELIAVDYKFNIAYEYLSDGLNFLYEKINNLEPSMAYYTGEKGIYFVPVGLINHNVLTENLGFKIPIKINFISDIEMGFKTKVSDYGMNNLLVELYLEIEVENDLITPNTKDSFSEKYEIIIASKVIIGSIPNIYGGVIEKDSAIVSS